MSGAIDTTGLTGSFAESRTLQAGARANPADLPPDLLLVLKHGRPSGTVSGIYNAVVYGPHSGQVCVGQFRIDFSTPSDAGPTVTQTGISNTLSQNLLGVLPSLTTFSVDPKGLVTWGTWKGAIDAESTSLLLYRERLFLLASKRTTHVESELSGQQWNTAVLMQYKDDTTVTVASGKGTASFSGGRFGVNSPKFTQTNQNVQIPTGTRPYRLSSSDSSLLQIGADDTFASITEQGFLGSADFHVVINPDSSERPALLVILK